MKYQQMVKNQQMISQIKATDKNAVTRFEFTNLGLMLLLMHFSLQQHSTHSSLSYALFITHLGFFLLWQPALNASARIHIKTLLPIILITSLMYFIFKEWFIAIWIIILTGLASGSALVNGLQRSLYALAAVILFLQLSLVLTPRLFELEVLDPQIELYIFYGLGIACVLIMLWPNKKQRSVQIDYLHSLLISFGLFSFYVSSILLSFTSHIHYLQALLMTALTVAVLFVLLSIIWLPRYGLSGIGQVWEQHILNIGNPFENWVKQTALLSQNNKITPQLFLEHSIAHLLTLSWVSGIRWSDPQHCETYGEESKYQTVFANDEIMMQLYSHVPMGSALKIHAKLLMHLMCYFYTSKLREISLKNQTHLKAVYETGAKLTHDIKNILQSFQTLNGVISASDDPAQSHKLLQKQIPLLSQRLQNTLDKLQTKTDTGRSFKAADLWWQELISRYHGRNIEFEGQVGGDIMIDCDVFDSILENLLENARSKRRLHPHTRIVTRIEIQHKQPAIRVCDDGEPVDKSIQADLFKQILPSKSGYGIGLFQSAQLALRHGFELQLVNNEAGNVCFELSAQGYVQGDARGYVQGGAQKSNQSEAPSS